MCILNETIVINIYVYTFVNIYFTLNLVYAIAYNEQLFYIISIILKTVSLQIPLKSDSISILSHSKFI